MLPVFVAFSLISGSNPYYLIPIFPAFALLAARSLVAEERIKGLWMPTLAALSIGVAFLVMAKGGLGPKVGDQNVHRDVAWPADDHCGCVALSVRPPYCQSNSCACSAGRWRVCSWAAGIGSASHPAYDVRPIAIAIHEAQASGHVVAHLGEYHNQYHFAGRLQSPLPLFDDAEPLKPGHIIILKPTSYSIPRVPEVLQESR